MAGLLMRWIASSMAIWFAAWLLEDVVLVTNQDALLAGAIVTLGNTIVRPIMVFLRLPVTIFPLGAFYSVVSLACVMFAADRLPGFNAGDFPTTVVTAVLVGVVSAVVTSTLHGEPAT